MKLQCLKTYFLFLCTCVFHYNIALPLSTNLVPGDYWSTNDDVSQDETNSAQTFQLVPNNGPNRYGDQETKSINDVTAEMDNSFTENKKQKSLITDKIENCLKNSGNCDGFFQCVSLSVGIINPSMVRSIILAVFPLCKEVPGDMKAKRAPFGGAMPRYEFLGDLMARVAKKPKRSGSDMFESISRSLSMKGYPRKGSYVATKSGDGRKNAEFLLEENSPEMSEVVKRMPEVAADGGRSAYHFNDGTIGDFANGLALDAYKSLLQQQRKSRSDKGTWHKTDRHIRPFVG